MAIRDSHENGPQSFGVVSAHSNANHELPGGSHCAPYGTFVPNQVRARWQKLGFVAAALAAVVAMTALVSFGSTPGPQELSEAAALRLAEEGFENEPQEPQEHITHARQTILSLAQAKGAPQKAVSLAVVSPPAQPVPPQPALTTLPTIPAGNLPAAVPIAAAPVEASTSATTTLAKSETKHTATETKKGGDSAHSAAHKDQKKEVKTSDNHNHLGAPQTEHFSFGATNFNQGVVAPTGPPQYTQNPAAPQHPASAAPQGDSKKTEAKKALQHAVDGHALLPLHSVLGMHDAQRHRLQPLPAAAPPQAEAPARGAVQNLAAHTRTAGKLAASVDSDWVSKQLGSPFADHAVKRSDDFPGLRPLWDN